MIFDALVIGAGPAGGMAALLLAQLGWKTAVVERVAFPRPKVCGEFLSSTNLPLFRETGLEGDYLAMAGPEIRRVGLYAGAWQLSSAMRSAGGERRAWGRALSREKLDALILERAVERGATLFQPFSVADWEACPVGYKARLILGNGQMRTVESRIIIAAHGSWSPGSLPSQPTHSEPRPSDLLAFKSHFLESRLPSDIMPLLVFPGGYGGMVTAEAGRTSYSTCVRRDLLARCRRAHPELSAGDAVFAYVTAHCAGARDALAGARLEHPWLAAGPMRPGFRSRGAKGVFRIGNAAGEAHPAIAEGITMGLQSAWLLVRELTGAPELLGSPRGLTELHRRYDRVWRRAFTMRIRVAALIAHWAMRPQAVAVLGPLLRGMPGLLSGVARLGGKGQVTLPVAPVSSRAI